MESLPIDEDLERIEQLPLDERTAALEEVEQCLRAALEDSAQA